MGVDPHRHKVVANDPRAPEASTHAAHAASATHGRTHRTIHLLISRSKVVGRFHVPGTLRFLKAFQFRFTLCRGFGRRHFVLFVRSLGRFARFFLGLVGGRFQQWGGRWLRRRLRDFSAQ
jgi:hypothetical protein